jgi:tetratricopeptide (TPR) repeat protein
VLQQTRDLGIGDVECHALLELSGLALTLGQGEQAEGQARLALQLAQEMGLAAEQNQAWAMLGRILCQQGDYAAATQAFRVTLTITTPPPPMPDLVNAWVGLAQTYLACNQLSEAHAYVDQILAWLETHRPLWIYDLFGLYLSCYKVLTAQQDPRAAAVLQRGYQLLQNRAAAISNPAKRQTYLQNVRSNCELSATWQVRFNQA